MTEQTHLQHQVVQTVVLVILETGFTFLVNHDPLLQIQAQKLIERNALIRLNVYPFGDLYIHFSEQGVLFDTQSNNRKVSLDARTNISTLLQLLFTGNGKLLRRFKSDGSVDVLDEFLDFLLLCTLPKMMLAFPQWFAKQKAPEQRNVSKSRISNVLADLEEKRKFIAKLKLENKELKYARKKAIDRAKKYRLAMFLSWVVAIVFFVLWFVQNYTLTFI